MFTGIVEETGTVVGVEATGDGRRLSIEADLAPALEPGQSVSVSGTCLTVESLPGTGELKVFLAEETLQRTYLGELAVGDAVNLERAMPADGRFDGHLVQGHVDAVVNITGYEPVGEDWRLRTSLPSAYDRYVVEKGSVALDGISLTVADRLPDGVEVAVVPTTREMTTLSGAAVGDPLHLEVDVLAKYVERQFEGRPS